MIPNTEGIDRYHARRSPLQPRIVDVILDHARRDPRRRAVVDASGSYTYGELLRLTSQVRRGLLALEIGAGDVVAVQLPNWREYAPVALGVQAIGAVVNPISASLRGRELEQILRLSGARVLLAADSFRKYRHADAAAQLKGTLPLQYVVALRGHAAGALGWEEFLAPEDSRDADPGLLRDNSTAPKRIAQLEFTSGTMGQPKGVMHTHESILSSTTSYIKRQKLGREDVFHVALPLGHSGGYVYGLTVGLVAGGTVVLQDTWHPEHMLELVREHRITYTSGPPTFLADLLGLRELDRDSLSTIRVFNCGGAPMSPSLSRDVVSVLSTALSRSYGMTEAPRCACTDRTTPIERILGTDGSPQPEMQLRITDSDGATLGRDHEGHIELRGPFAFAGYIQGREFTDEFFRDGFFRTGDIGRIDEQGYLVVTGREKDVIVRGGEKIPVAEIEAILMEHPRVAEVVVLGRSDARLGERTVAVIRPVGAPVGLEEIRSFLQAREVTKQYWPEEVHIRTEFPRGPTGKVLKSVLRDALDAQDGARHDPRRGALPS